MKIKYNVFIKQTAGKKANAVFWYIFLFLNCFYSCSKVQDLKPVNAAVSSASANELNGELQPNIIFILSDDVGYEIPAVNGGQSYNTPNIDFMAANGVRFTQCYGSALCSPSRSMLFTGKYNFRNYTQWGVMSTSEKTIGNMFKDAGYATCYAGKWQLDGGDNSALTFGYEHYSIWNPFEFVPAEEIGPMYKSPIILQDGAYLPAEQTLNKYSIDIYTNYITNFIDSNRENPFFIFYSIPLCHDKFCPTPDDAEWSTFDFSKGSTRFFPNMVKYMDKQIGLLRNKIDSAALQRPTIFIFLGDNGTPTNITSAFNGYNITGEKGKTTTYGTHVPLIFYSTGNFPCIVSDQLVDFTDFMPTLASLAGIPLPTTYGTIDGKDFSEVVTGTATYSSRDYIFSHYQPRVTVNDQRLARYAANSNYKLYSNGEFFNVVTDVHELNRLKTKNLTPAEKVTKQYFQSILNTMHN